jgi:hypothetical protein
MSDAKPREVKPCSTVPSIDTIVEARPNRSFAGSTSSVRFRSMAACRSRSAAPSASEPMIRMVNAMAAVLEGRSLLASTARNECIVKSVATAIAHAIETIRRLG